jgi:thioredoxin reductase (NADPH)
MVNNVQLHIKKLNWGYKTTLASNNVKYYNKLAELQDPHTIKVFKLNNII